MVPQSRSMPKSQGSPEVPKSRCPFWHAGMVPLLRHPPVTIVLYLYAIVPEISPPGTAGASRGGQSSHETRISYGLVFPSFPERIPQSPSSPYGRRENRGTGAVPEIPVTAGASGTGTETASACRVADCGMPGPIAGYFIPQQERILMRS